MAENGGGRTILIGALLISLSIIGGSFFVANSLDRATSQLEIATGKLDDLQVAGGRPRGARPDRPQRPDPGREYDVEVGEAPTLGSEDAPVTIVEWSDFQCPFCKRVTPTIDQIKDEYGDKVRFVFKHMPLSIHPQAPGAHAAAEAAHRQGKFWEMYDLIFENQRDLDPATFERYAEKLDLDMKQFRKDVEAEEVKRRIAEDMQQAQTLGVTGTPSFFINGRFLSGAQPFANFKRYIDDALEKNS
jgi:protein-disulfide isomerase